MENQKQRGTNTIVIESYIQRRVSNTVKTASIQIE